MKEVRPWRDRELLILLMTGMTAEEVAARLGMAASDVEAEVERLVVEHDAASRADLLFEVALGRV